MDDLFRARAELTLISDLLSECRQQPYLSNVLVMNLDKAMGVSLNLQRRINIAIEAPRTVSATCPFHTPLVQSR